MTENEFLEKYNISEVDFAASGFSFDRLTEIQTDYVAQFQKFDDAGANLVRSILRYPVVHSVKYRIKDSEHLMAKIIRKSVAQPKLTIDIGNYHDHIRDIIGIRILHLFKADWTSIHEELIANFKFLEKPEANVRRGDLPDFVNYYKENGCKIKYHSAGYRSVHYLIKTEPTKKPLVCEVQVRTIFEEAWSEIDHKVRYPYFTDNAILNQYLALFNRLAGSADEMGGFVLNLKEYALVNANNAMELQKMQAIVQTSSLKAAEKKEMEEGLQKIRLPLESKIPAFETLRKTLASMKGPGVPLISPFLSPEVAAALAAIQTKLNNYNPDSNK